MLAPGLHQGHAVAAADVLCWVLTGRYVDGGDDVGGVRVETAYAASDRRTDHVLRYVHVHQSLDGRLQHGSDHRRGHHRLAHLVKRDFVKMRCFVRVELVKRFFYPNFPKLPKIIYVWHTNHRLPSSLDPVDRCRFLVGAKVAAETQDLHVGELTLHVPQRRLGTLREHVHPHRVAGMRDEPDEKVAAGDPTVHPLQAGVAARRIEARLHRFEVVGVLHPDHCFACPFHGRETDHRTASHPVRHYAALDAAL